MAKKTICISPSEIKKLRKKSGLTQKQAAEIVHISLRQWQKFEEKESSKTHNRISDATLELFCLKTGLPFPPNFSENYYHGKTISFAGGPGGVGRSSLTRDMALLLTNDGYDVLVITDKWGQLTSAKKYYIAQNKQFPKILPNSDEISWDSHNPLGINFSEIKNNYDFIFLDLEERGEHRRIDNYPVDIIVTPAKLNDRFDISIKNFISFLERLKEKNSNTIAALLLVGVDNEYTIDLYYQGFDRWLNDRQMTDARHYLDYVQQAQENELEILQPLRDHGVYIFGAYTSTAYLFYEGLLREKNGLFNNDFHFIENPNTISAHELTAIKNEMLRLLGIKYS